MADQLQENLSLDSGYLYRELPKENVFGYVKKVRKFRESIEKLRNHGGKRLIQILDIGCGSGYAVTRFLARPDQHVLGIDMYPPNIAYAKRNFGQIGLDFACMDANSLSSDGKIFDVVVMADVLEHLHDPASILETAVELLAADGRLLVTIPNGRGPFEMESALSRVPLLGPSLIKVIDLFVAVLNKTVMKGVWSRAVESTTDAVPYNTDSGHVHFFSRSEIFRLLNDAGLEVVESGNLSFLAGHFTNYLLGPSRRFCRWNTDVADHIPHWLASTWFFECQKLKN